MCQGREVATGLFRWRLVMMQQFGATNVNAVWGDVARPGPGDAGVCV